MTQEEKELLLKDICARLPYEVKIQESILWYEEGKEVWKYRDIDLNINNINNINCINIDFIKPYLFPLSSMTDEMWDKEFRGYNITEFTRDSFKYDCETLEFYDHNPYLSDMIGFINQLIKNHFDIYGLIPKGLAIDATNLNIY